MEIPHFCPYKGCLLHAAPKPDANWWVKHGTHSNRYAGIVQRFRCKSCGRTFSEQTFRIDFYAKKILDYRLLENRLITTNSLRDMARFFDVHLDTIVNKLSRLGRQFIAVQTILTSGRFVPENLVADGFESFSVSQYFPNNIHLLAGQESQFLYFFNHVTIRRKGRMTTNQKRRRSILEKQYLADPEGVRKSFRDVLEKAESVASLSPDRPITLFTDMKTDYELAFRAVKPQSLIHRTVSSRRERTVDNPLFAVNYLDRQFRKDLDEYVRETVCFGRNVNNAMTRLSIYAVYHNFEKAYRERFRKVHPWTHAEMIGISRIAIRKILNMAYRNRFFLSHLSIEGFPRKVWLRQLVTPLKKKPEYLPCYAAA